MPDPIWLQLVLQLVLILINAFFASAEIAVISLNESMVRHQAEEGDRQAARLLAILQAPTRFLSTIQIGITLAGFLGAAFAAENFANRLTALAVSAWQLDAGAASAVSALNVAVITILLSFFTLIFGELVPKRVAMQRTESVARLCCGVVSALSAVMRPAIWLLTACTNGVLRLMRIDPNASDEEVGEDEIMAMVDMGEESGTIESAEKELIENVFEFNNITAGDVMVHRTDMVMLWVEDTEAEILQAIESSGLSRFPVYEEDADNILGILSTREYLLNLHKASPLPLRELLRPAYFVPQSVRADLLFRDMQSKAVHMAIVVDEYGGTSGLLTMEDLLEELVGNIYDEFDPKEEQEIIQLEDNLWRISGSAELEAVSEALHVSLPEDEDYETLGGLIYSQLSVIPEDGSRPEVSAYGLHIQVEELSDRRVEWALVSVEQPEPAGEEPES